MSEEKTVSVGIVGPGFWTETMYLPALKGMIHDLPIPDNI